MQNLKYAEKEPEGIDARRNPYLIDYEKERKRRMQAGGGRPERHTAQRQLQLEMWEPVPAGSKAERGMSRTVPAGSRTERGMSRTVPAGSRTERGMSRTVSAGSRAERGMSRTVSAGSRTERGMSRTVSAGSRTERGMSRTVLAGSRTERGMSRTVSAGSRAESGTRRTSRTGSKLELEVWRPADRKAQAAARARRRKAVRRQKIAVGAWILCLVLLCVCIFWGNSSTSAAEKDQNLSGAETSQQEPVNLSAAMVQGIPAEEFAKHPVWTENYLTPNEYSRPGDALEEVKNIFVHYTANPGTSAAQNRSYFEQQKDTHEASVSAHFIIGYDGEIIQCLPLDEIGYAVMTRNYDSISIECCYKAENGSFTQETYDSLISLLAWLTDVYDLDVEDILRHYDCGGKKCPLYYTEHPDAWEQLKEDVADVL